MGSSSTYSVIYRPLTFRLSFYFVPCNLSGLLSDSNKLETSEKFNEKTIKSKLNNYFLKKYKIRMKPSEITLMLE